MFFQDDSYLKQSTSDFDTRIAYVKKTLLFISVITITHWVNPAVKWLNCECLTSGSFPFFLAAFMQRASNIRAATGFSLHQ